VLGISRVAVIVFVGYDMFCLSYLKLSFCLSHVNIDIIKVLLCLIVICLFISYSTMHSEMYNFKKVKVILGVCIVVTHVQKNLSIAIGMQTTRITQETVEYCIPNLNIRFHFS
jgi:hypothetical protein